MLWLSLYAIVLASKTQKVQLYYENITIKHCNCSNQIKKDYKPGNSMSVFYLIAARYLLQLLENNSFPLPQSACPCYCEAKKENILSQQLHSLPQ